MSPGDSVVKQAGRAERIAEPLAGGRPGLLFVRQVFTGKNPLASSRFCVAHCRGSCLLK
jgi:hypothetical protein